MKRSSGTDATDTQRRRIRLLALVAAFGLILHSAATVLTAGGFDVHGMLEACQRAMGALGIHVSPDQMRAIMGSCMGTGH